MGERELFEVVYHSAVGDPNARLLWKIAQHDASIVRETSVGRYRVEVAAHACSLAKPKRQTFVVRATSSGGIEFKHQRPFGN